MVPPSVFLPFFFCFSRKKNDSNRFFRRVYLLNSSVVVVVVVVVLITIVRVLNIECRRIVCTLVIVLAGSIGIVAAVMIEWIAVCRVSFVLAVSLVFWFACSGCCLLDKRPAI